MNFQSLLKKENLSILFLFLPNILRWMPFRQFSLTINIGTFPFFWPSIFYLLYILMTPKTKQNLKLTVIQKIISLGFIFCPIILILVEDGLYAGSLWLQDLIFYVLTYALFFHVPSEKQFKFIKPIVYFLYFYILIQMIVSALGIYQFDESDQIIEGMKFIRAGTKAGDSNQTTIVLFLFMTLITSYYSNKTKLNITLIVLTIIATAMAATRSTLISCTGYFVVYLFFQLKGKSTTQKFGIGMLASILVIIIIQFNIFADVLFRHQELKLSGNLTSNRYELIEKVVNLPMNDSPLLGVGHGRVYPPTDEVGRYKEQKDLSYSKYTGAPHNVWILTMCEYGIIGLFALISVFIDFLKNMKLSKPGTWAVIIIFLVLFNTEAILIHDQSLLYIYLLIIASLYKSAYPDKKLIQ